MAEGTPRDSSQCLRKVVLGNTSLRKGAVEKAVLGEQNHSLCRGVPQRKPGFNL